VREIQEIEDELDRLQGAYVQEEDEVAQMEIERKFTHLLQEATDTDGMDRIAASVTITNWTRES
jgi:hypothetical protein